MKKISRRSFLKVSGTMAAAGALAACGGSSSTSTAASSEAAPSVEAKAVDGLPDMSKETLNFSSDKVGSGSYNMIVAMSKVLEKAGGFQTVNVNPDSPGGMGAPYLFASGNTDLAFINGAPAKWAMEEGTLGKPATSGYAAVIGGLTAVCYINCVSNAFLQKYNVSTIEEIFEQKLPLRIGCSAKGSMDAEGAYLLLEYFGVTEDDLKSWGGSITNQGGDHDYSGAVWLMNVLLDAECEGGMCQAIGRVPCNKDVEEQDWYKNDPEMMLYASYLEDENYKQIQNPYWLTEFSTFISDDMTADFQAVLMGNMTAQDCVSGWAAKIDEYQAAYEAQA